MKVAIIIGHKKGNTEFNYNLVTASKMFDELRKRNIDVFLDTYDTEVYEEVAYIKKLGLTANDIVISIHYNGGGGDGFECYYFKGDNEMIKLCKAIESEVLNIGQNSRGVKADTGYVIIKDVVPHSIILEGAFMDNPTDWKGIDLNKVGVAYANGVLKYLGVATTQLTTPTEENYLFFGGKRYKIV